MKRKLSTELDRTMVISYIQRLDIKNKLYTVETIEKRLGRTISQNSLYWLWLTCIEQETGNDRNYMHQYYMEKFLLPDEKIILGKKILFYTTTNKDTLQFKNYLDKIQIDANVEFSIKLPLPEEKYWEEFYSYYIDKL